MRFTTKYYCEETRELKTLKEWEEWFQKNGNHEADGWRDFESWLFDMIRGNLLSIYHVVAEFEIEGEQVIICSHLENGSIDYYSINFKNADFSVSGSWQDITEEFYDSYGEELSDYVKLSDLF